MKREAEGFLGLLEPRHALDAPILRGRADGLVELVAIGCDATDDFVGFSVEVKYPGSNQFGAFASDTLMKLGLLGTIIGFIMMLAPIAGLDAADHASVKSSMGLMSDGMAVAMYTTLTGLIGSILVQTQYYMLDKATARLFALATNLTEVFVVSVLERGPDGHVR